MNGLKPAPPHVLSVFFLAALGVAAAASQGRGGPPPARTTPLFECGSDQTAATPIPLSWAAIALAADSRLYVPCAEAPHSDQHRESRDARVLEDGWHSLIPEFRALAVAGYGRLGRPEYVGMTGGTLGLVAPRATTTPVAPTTWVPGVLALALDDPAANVRREAANAIGNAMSGAQVEPDDADAHPPTADQMSHARAYLDARLQVEKDDNVVSMIFETLGRLKYSDDQARNEVEGLLVMQAFGAPVRILGAVKGLESLLRAAPRRAIQAGTRDKLRELAVSGLTGMPVPTVAGPGTAERAGDEATLARVRRLAMQSLQTARDDDVVTLLKSSRDADWQVRRLAALRLDTSRPDHAPVYEQLKADRVFQVRFEVVGAEARAATRDHDCSALLARVDDPEPTVAIHAIDLLPAGCLNAEVVVGRLKAVAGQIATAGPSRLWYLPTHAALSLARLSAGIVQPLVAAMARHPEWQVRAAAATIAGVLRDSRTAVTLSNIDSHANVRTAALEALAAMKSPDVTAPAIRALTDGSDHQLLRTAATVLKGTPPALRDDANLALLSALDRLTRLGADNSRDARVAILQRLGELLPPEWTSRLNPFAGDFDPRVRAAAVTAYETALGTTNAPPGKPVHRYPLQPTTEQFQALPTRARIKMAMAMPGTGVIDMDLLINDAPVTVARFVELVKAGYYNGLTFHRVVPNFVIQGGSPGANEYVGAPRFWRDEVGTIPHTHGAVGISTRGHDTGDGQIFIDLTDQPRLDHDYTVFARITSGLDIVDHILEGARIESITPIVR